MLIHPWDAVEDWRSLLPGHDFGQVVAGHGPDGWPVVAPAHFVVEGEWVLLHLARPNPLWRALEIDDRVVVTTVGDYVYVDAATNGADAPEVGVPTSYYSALQIFGRAEVLDDPVDKAAVLARQLAHFEPVGSTRVTPSVDVESDRRQLPGIRGLRIRIDHVLAKQKYGGNRSPEERRQIAEALDRRAGPMDAVARDHVARRTVEP